MVAAQDGRARLFLQRLITQERISCRLICPATMNWLETC